MMGVPCCSKKFPSLAMDDEERLLMERESRIYEEKISKVCVRDAMHRAKSHGYENVRKADIPIIKIFIGYISQLDLLRYPELINALSLSIARSTVRQCLELILKSGFTRLEDLLGVLKYAS